MSHRSYLCVEATLVQMLLFSKFQQVNIIWQKIQVHEYSEELQRFSLFMHSLTCLVSGAGGDNTEWPWASNGIGPDGEAIHDKLLQSTNHEH